MHSPLALDGLLRVRFLLAAIRYLIIAAVVIGAIHGVFDVKSTTLHCDGTGPLDSNLTDITLRELLFSLLWRCGSVIN